MIFNERPSHLLDLLWMPTIAILVGEKMTPKVWKLNTSNPGKLEEFKRLFEAHGCSFEASHVDLEELEADPLTVIAHKASQLEEDVIVEDTSLEVEGASVGIHVRWLLDHLTDYMGHKAECHVLLAFREGDQIFIYKGSVEGTLVESKGTKGFGFDPIFLPTGATKTLGEAKPDHFNARAKAVEALMKNQIWKTHPRIEEWSGPWQKKKD